MVTRSIEKAQRKVEGRNFDIRKQLLEYDNVANDQRTIIYRQRNELMASDDISDLLKEMREEVVSGMIDDYIPPQSVPEQWNIPALEAAVKTELNTSQPIQQWLDDDDQLYEDQLKSRLIDILEQEYEVKSTAVGENMRQFEKQISLQILDGLWKDHLATMDHLRQGIFLRSYGGKNPRQEYKREAFDLFTELLDNLQREVVKVLSRVQIRQEDAADAIERKRREEAAKERMNYQHQNVSVLSGSAAAGENQVAGGPQQTDRRSPFVRDVAKVGRNDPCPCGSGKKYKLCCGKIT